MNEYNNIHSDSTETEARMPHESKTGSNGPLAGVVIIILVLILGGLYFWGSYVNEQEAADSTLTESLETELAGPEDEPDQIGEDLDAFDGAAFDAQLEADLQAVESQL